YDTPPGILYLHTFQVQRVAVLVSDIRHRNHVLLIRYNLNQRPPLTNLEAFLDYELPRVIPLVEVAGVTYLVTKVTKIVLVLIFAPEHNRVAWKLRPVRRVALG